MAGTQLDKCYKIFKETKEKNARSFARLNDFNELGCFYVGGSKSLKNRIKQQLGYGAQNTNSLQTIHWSKKLKRGGFAIEIFRVDTSLKISDRLLQCLEDHLRDSHRPIFGRRGAK